MIKKDSSENIICLSCSNKAEKGESYCKKCSDKSEKLGLETPDISTGAETLRDGIDKASEILSGVE